MFCACSFHGNFMNNLLSYCGLVDATISASEKDLLVLVEFSYMFPIQGLEDIDSIAKRIARFYGD